MLLTFLLGIQITLSKTELILPTKSVSFSVEQNQSFKILEKEVPPNLGFLKEKFGFVIFDGISDLRSVRQGEQSGIFNDGKKIQTQDYPWYQFAYEIIGAGRQFLREAQITENYWNSENPEHQSNWLNTPPYLTGVGNGVIDEIKSIPLLVDFGIELATNEEARTEVLNTVQDLSWDKITTGVSESFTSTLDELGSGPNGTF